MWAPRVITNEAIGMLLERSGKIQYVPIRGNRNWSWRWELWAILPDGEHMQVLSSKTGEVRIFKSSDALLGFHMRTFPNTKVFPISTVDTLTFNNEGMLLQGVKAPK